MIGGLLGPEVLGASPRSPITTEHAAAHDAALSLLPVTGDALRYPSVRSAPVVTLAADAFRLLADPTRIRILWALLQGETSVNCLAELVQPSPSGVSQHLAKLRLAGLVHGRREGNFMYYAAGSNHVRALLNEALFHADHTDRGLHSDVPHSHETGRSATDAAVR